MSQLRALNAVSPIVQRIDVCAEQAGLTRDDLLAMSASLHEAYNRECQVHESGKTDKEAPTNDTLQQHTLLVRELLEANRPLMDRLDALEKRDSQCQGVKSNVHVQSSTTERIVVSRKRLTSTRLSAVWYDWYCGEPRTWSMDIDRNKRSDAANIVAYMKLFLSRGFLLDEELPTYRNDVMRLGNETEVAVIKFLHEQGVRSAGSSAVLKHIRALSSIIH
ncbi:hypothetical protein AeMF1_012990 [Aphanomyces euteiches]|nr:hypothetical protein AeMF1_012990 [Aphanomyces euteiches]KAH9184616.1 hypothetical protein AeNC1_013408 [Aphanomyces euteiches]